MGDEPKMFCCGNLRSRLSRHKNKVVTPQKKGDQYIYEEPKSLIQSQDYDVPPSRYVPNQPGGTLSPPNPAYPEPQGVGDDSLLPPPPPHIYAVPEEERAQGQMPTSNRSSMASMFSTGSNSNSLGAESHTSSLDLTTGQEIYDVPPLAKTVVQNNAAAVVKAAKALPPPPVPCNLPSDTYDKPRNTKEFSPDRDYMEINEIPSSKPGKESQSRYIEDYDVPKSDTSRSSGDSGIDTSKLEHLCDIGTDEVYDTPKKAVAVQLHGTPPTNNTGHESSPGMEVYDTPRSKKAQHDLYDSPKNLQEVSSRPSLIRQNPPTMRTASPKRFGMLSGHESGMDTYDVPTSAKESLLQVSGDSSDRLSTGSTCSETGPIPFESLQLDQQAAISRLNSLIVESQKSSSKLLSYVKHGWRRPELLDSKIPVIKETSHYVHRTMRSFVEFGQGTLANSATVGDKKLAKKIQKQLRPLQESLQEVGKCLGNMECSGMWKVARLGHHSPKERGDDLDLVVLRTREFPANVSALASLIKGNASLLFGQQQPATKSEEPKEETDNAAGKASSLKRAPPPVKPKPKLSVDRKASLDNGRRSSMQDRPLPTIPKEENGSSRSDSQDRGAIYNVPKGEMDHAGDNHRYDYDYVALSRENSVTETSNNNSEIEWKSPSPNYREASPSNSVRSNTPEPFSESDYDVPSSNKPLVSREALQPPTIRTSGLSPRFKERLEQLQAEAQQPVVIHTDPEASYDVLPGGSTRASQVTNHDRQILAYYGQQVDTHTELLHSACEAFFACCEYNQPPKVFIAHSKFVILAAHKLVYIADAIAHCVGDQALRVKVMTCANRLCDTLKLTVTATKGAALNFPQILSVQEMVDRVVEITQAAAVLKKEVSRPLQT